MIMVMPSFFNSLIDSKTSFTKTGSSAEVISSNKRARGWVAIDRMIATRCCWPPLKRSGNSSALSKSPNLSNKSFASSRACSFLIL